MSKRIEIFGIPVIGDGHGEYDWMSIMVMVALFVFGIVYPYICTH